MDLRLQPRPEIEVKSADKGYVSREEYFVKKVLEKINQYFFPAFLARNWRPKAELIYPSTPNEDLIKYQCDFNRDVQNCFVEDYAEEVYLRSPPPCFVVLGKFGTSTSKLSQDIAHEYNSVLIQVEDVVNQVVNSPALTSGYLKKFLRLGISLTLNFILSLVCYLAHTPEAKHRGYVLCGLPCLPQDKDLSVEQQLNYLFCWENKPTVFIHVLYEDEDLVRTRSSIRYEIVGLGTSEEHKLVRHCLPLQENVEEDETDGEAEDESSGDEHEPDIDISPSRPWIQMPGDEECRVWTQLELFDKIIKPALNLWFVRIDPQYLITVDSRVQNQFEVVKSRLSLLQIWKVPVPFPFIPLNNDEIKDKNVKQKQESVEIIKGSDSDTEIKTEEESEDDEENMEIKRVADEPPQVSFLTLFSKKTLSPKFRWELSHYNYVCPVTMRAGVVVEGKTKFAVGFMKYIYYLSDKESMTEFLKNPRPFLLPIRPKPLSQFFIVGYPYCGKTTLAKLLAEKLSIPLINLTSLLKEDIERKKEVFEEFCRKKAESREIIRLTTQAWKEWRMDEENRIALLEDWIAFIQSILNQRIEQFYSEKRVEDEVSTKTASSNDDLEKDSFSGESRAFETILEVRGIAIRQETSSRAEEMHERNSTPSAKIIQALKYADFDFDKKGLEVEANLFFSALWNSFSAFDILSELNTTGGKKRRYEEPGESASNKSLAGEEFTEAAINWCSLLPPQSLSSFLLKKKPYTIRERRQSFRMLLAAASKAYWEPSSLKMEFTKWRLPCFMDIPLCEIFVDNPILLYKYCPDFIKQRPMIPDPIDPTHPQVVEAGNQAVKRAKMVTLQHTKEEVGLLLRDAIEKYERDGMRISGTIISPGGWVVDGMVLDLQVWCMLAKENITPTHVFFMTDSEPGFQRIVNTWCKTYHENLFSEESLSDYEYPESPQYFYGESEELIRNTNLDSSSKDTFSDNMYADDDSGINIIDLVQDAYDSIVAGDSELDDIFDLLASDEKLSPQSFFRSSFIVDPYSFNIIHRKARKSCHLADEYALEETTASHPLPYGSYNRILMLNRPPFQWFQDMALGAQLQVVTNKVLKMLSKAPVTNKNLIEKKLCYRDGVKFFLLLLTLSQKLNEVKEYLTSLNRGIVIVDVDVNNRTPLEICNEIVEELYSPFVKKPRELEPFEVEELNAIIEAEEAEKNKHESSEDLDDTESGDNELKNVEDIRIYGESGPFCIVALERNCLLRGRPEHVLRYYGKLYYFWSEENKLKFLEDPEKYAPYYSPIRSFPPLRIYLIGAFGGEKTHAASVISKQCSIHFIDHLKYLARKLIPHIVPFINKLRALDSSLLISESHNQEAREALEEFKGAVYKKRQFWMENPPIFTDSWKDNARIKELLNLKETYVASDELQMTYKTIDKSLDEIKNKFDSETDDVSETSSDVQYLSMEDTYALLQEYVHGDAHLTDYCISKTLKNLWTKAPYTTEGFIIKDFPLRLSDTQIILDNNWIPDVVIEINLSEEEAIHQNIERIMVSWDTKLQQQMTEEHLLEDTVKSIQETRSYIRRMELMMEKGLVENKPHSNLHKGAMKSSSRKFIEIQEKPFPEKAANKERSSLKLNQELDENWQMLREKSETRMELEREIDEIIKNEFPTLVFNPNFETYKEGKERVVEDVKENYYKDKLEISKVKAKLDSINVPWVEINNQDNISDVFIKLNAFKKRINQKGEFAFETSMEMAEKLLQQGYYFLSKFGRLCPVQSYRNKNPVNMFRPLKSRGKIFPIIYRNYLYFVGGENEKAKFLDDPIKYTFHEPHHPNIPLRLSVIGPPKSGKTTLCKRLGAMFGLKVITMGSAIRFVLEQMSGTVLNRKVKSYLKRGCFLPLSLKIEVLVAYLNDPDCVTQGYVFDGFPYDAAMSQGLAEKKKLPFVILSLVGDADFSKRNRKNLNLNDFRLPYKQRVNLDLKHQEWKQTYKRFAEWNQSAYNNLYEIDAKSNVADIFYKSYDIFRKSYFDILNYVEYSTLDKVLSLKHLCVSKHEFESRCSGLGYSCPVCWVENVKLKNPVNETRHLGYVQYLSTFYWICSEHMNEFCKNPNKYLPPRVPTWPVSFPKLVTKEMLNRELVKLHGRGRCPVTRIDFPQSLQWEGSWHHAVLYQDKVYLCKNQKMKERFIARPWRYSSADTTFEERKKVKSKAVENLGPPKLASLPPIGFLEQTVANLIHKALQILGSVRPVYPKLTPTCTGNIFLALYLKVHNPKRHALQLEKEYLNFMFLYCKGYRFRVPFCVKRTLERDQGDDAQELTDSSESTSQLQEEENQSSEGTIHSYHGSLDPRMMMTDDPQWCDFSTQADKKMWSAKMKNIGRDDMYLNSDDELQEIPDIPKLQVIIRYASRRSSPLPPVPNCYTFLYSVPPRMAVQEKFNVNTLYQKAPSFVSPYPESVVCNPERQFSVEIYSRTGKLMNVESSPNIWHGKRTVPEGITFKPISEEEAAKELLENRFMPRFQILDTVHPAVLSLPEVVVKPPVIYEPFRDYTYTLLMSQFFQNSHVLNCYEWEECKTTLEYESLLDRSLGLCNAQSQFLHQPRITTSAKTLRSTKSYEQILEASNTFFHPKIVPSKEILIKDEEEENSSIVNFIHLIIMEKLDEVFARLSESYLSYDSYEINILEQGANLREPTICIREIFPYPPMIWDIASRPYYSYNALPSVFAVPELENIAHERHLSLLDGIIESSSRFRFVRYPTWVAQHKISISTSPLPKIRRKCHKESVADANEIELYFDFFNFNWTSFLTCPFFMAYNKELYHNFKPSKET